MAGRLSHCHYQAGGFCGRREEGDAAACVKSLPAAQLPQASQNSSSPESTVPIIYRDSREKRLGGGGVREGHLLWAFLVLLLPPP